MASIKYNDPVSGVSLPWVGDELSREHVLAGGFMLNAAGFIADAQGRVEVPSGTLVGRTITERTAGTGFGPVAIDGTSGAATDDEVYLVIYDVYDAAENPECALYRHGSLVYEDKLPVGTDVSVVRSNYETLAS